MEGDAVALEGAEDTEEGKVGFGSGFKEPLHAMGPGAVVDDVGQMRVKREGEKALGRGPGLVGRGRHGRSQDKALPGI